MNQSTLQQRRLTQKWAPEYRALSWNGPPLMCWNTLLMVRCLERAKTTSLLSMVCMATRAA